MGQAMDQPQRANWLLVVGATIGIALAASGLLEDAKPALGMKTLAMVNGDGIDKAQYLNLLDLLAKDKRNPLTKEDQRSVLQRMIDEKLLLGRGIEIGLTESSPQVRKLIVQQVMQVVLSESETEQTGEQELRDFYQSNIAYFTIPPRLQVQRMLFKNVSSTGDNQSRAQQAFDALVNGELYNTVKQQYADADLLSIPNDPLPKHKLLQYLGPIQTDIALGLNNGELSKPFKDGDNVVIIVVINHVKANVPPLEAIRPQVQSEFERRRGDDALASYLEDLRTIADITIDEKFLDDLASATRVAAAP
ncbi:MAG: parvulin-like peptidyl-prolyl isomerase [Pseudomonadales bacterium]|jgi:parvulin-like peptidyl-prolyl isomerase